MPTSKPKKTNQSLPPPPLNSGEQNFFFGRLAIPHSPFFGGGGGTKLAPPKFHPAKLPTIQEIQGTDTGKHLSTAIPQCPMYTKKCCTNFICQ
eukprot:NODE_4591_length_646_cov_15.130653_g3935_i0.p1 GENE.NODE_4591_length_646_cov_15.130653_g3935_i0~~NODE_4591_length_646_cov_15.130653_g3935_i0.p1  ORF type:complete len:93 (+),score=3.20 NODE_4591_length_646_cov_15.130653_g3935_i0:331-609(+)